jgi:predicted nucleic acid-binding protein
VWAWLDSAPEDELCLSVLMVGEICQGVERLRRRDLAGGPPAGLADRLVPVTTEICEEWGGSTSLPFRSSTA